MPPPISSSSIPPPAATTRRDRFFSTHHGTKDHLITMIAPPMVVPGLHTATLTLVPASAVSPPPAPRSCATGVGLHMVPAALIAIPTIGLTCTSVMSMTAPGGSTTKTEIPYPGLTSMPSPSSTMKSVSPSI